MEVEVRLFAVFREGRFKKKRLEFPAGTSLGQVLEQLGIPQKHVGILLVNGQGACGERSLSSDDVIAVFPAVGGG